MAHFRKAPKDVKRYRVGLYLEKLNKKQTNKKLINWPDIRVRQSINLRKLKLRFSQ